MEHGKTRSGNIQIALALAQILFSGGTVTSHLIRDHFGVSRATAKRYMRDLERGLPVQVNVIKTDERPSPHNAMSLMK